MAHRMLGLFAGLALLVTGAGAAQAADSVDALARDVTRLESLRAVKDVQRNYAQYGQFGLWGDMADLFATDGKVIWGDKTVTGRAAIRAWLAAQGPQGLAPGAMNTLLTENPLVNLSADGTSAKGRWSHIAMTGDGKGQAHIIGGIFENDYVLEAGRWKIATLHYFPQYEGSYADGWSNVGQQDLPIVPYHFDADSQGVPIPAPVGAAPHSGATPAGLKARIAALNDEDDVRNLQSAYGYYVDRRMWDDVADLFAKDAMIEIAGAGTFKGAAGVRKALALMGPAGLTRGILNEHPQFDAIVKVSPGGHEAWTRGTELGLIGDAGKGTSAWEFNVFRNRFVKEGGIWKIREMRIVPVMKADYKTGWADGGTLGRRLAEMPAFLGPNPATGRAVALDGRTPFAVRPMTPAIAAPAASAPGSLDDLRRRYLRSLTYDGTQNVSAAYGYYLDDFQWPPMSRIFALKGNKQSPFAGYYMGRERIDGAATAMWGPTRDPMSAKRNNLAFHWRFQPVIIVSHDGRSSTLRTRLFQPLTVKWERSSGKPNPNGLNGGMYPNDQIVLEDGVYRFWSITIDEHYFTTPNWEGGWSAAKEPPAGERPQPTKLVKIYPPDVLISDLGKREEGFRGGTGETITWPGILPMWFHYRNPVSGRTPDLYWPDCVPCTMLPDASMTRHGYTLPPSGPQVDGIEVKAP